MTSATVTATDRPLSAGVTIPLIFRATVSEMIRRRILVFLGLICAIPLTLALIWRLFGMDFMDADQFFSPAVMLVQAEECISNRYHAEKDYDEVADHDFSGDR